MKILLLSDLHSKKSALVQIMSSVGAKEAGATVLAGDLTTLGSREESLELLGLLGKRAFAVPGNMDSWECLQAMRDTGALLHGQRLEFSGHWLAGFGGGLTGQAGEIVNPEKTILEKLGAIVHAGDIVVTHLPPKNSGLDSSGGGHIGSASVRKIAGEKKPAFLFCGHAHGSRGTELIGNCLCVNPGPAELGCAALVGLEKRECELL